MAAHMVPEEGEKWVRLNTHYEVREVADGIVTMYDRTFRRTVSETIERFREEVEAGRAVHHPDCEHCGLPVDPEEAREGPLHYECWFEGATVRERCEAEAETRGGLRMLAAEALRSDDPQEHLLDVIGDPARTFHDRTDAENLLTGAVDTSELLDASVRCPNCREGEAFEMTPETGAVHCHCGELLKPAD